MPMSGGDWPSQVWTANVLIPPAQAMPPPLTQVQRGTQVSKNMGGKGSGVLIGPREVTIAVESLYNDQLKPYGRILRKRIAEGMQAAGLEVSDEETKSLKSICESCSWLFVEPEDGGDWCVLIVGRVPNFVDVYSPQDRYPESMWNAAAEYFESLGNLGKEEMALPGGRYSCAHALVQRSLPFLAGRSLGQVCHIVQLAISQKKLLGYLNGAVVPYAHSQSKVKERCAAGQKPCATAARQATTEPWPLATWESVRACIRDIFSTTVPGAGNGLVTVPLSNIKRLFRSRFHMELSETALGHAKLSELLQDERLADICTVKLQGHGYVVVPQWQFPIPQARTGMAIRLADELPPPCPTNMSSTAFFGNAYATVVPGVSSVPSTSTVSATGGSRSLTSSPSHSWDAEDLSAVAPAVLPEMAGAFLEKEQSCTDLGAPSFQNCASSDMDWLSESPEAACIRSAGIDGLPPGLAPAMSPPGLLVSPLPATPAYLYCETPSFTSPLPPSSGAAVRSAVLRRSTPPVDSPGYTNQGQWYSTSPVPAGPSYLFCSTPSLLSPLPPTPSYADPMQVPLPGQGCAALGQDSGTFSTLLPTYFGFGDERPCSRNELIEPVGGTRQQFCPDEPLSFDDLDEMPAILPATELIESHCRSSHSKPPETPSKNSRCSSVERQSSPLPTDTQPTRSVGEAQSSSLMLTPLKTPSTWSHMPRTANIDQGKQEWGTSPISTYCPQRQLLLSQFV